MSLEEVEVAIRESDRCRDVTGHPAEPAGYEGLTTGDNVQGTLIKQPVIITLWTDKEKNGFRKSLHNMVTWLHNTESIDKTEKMVTEIQEAYIKQKHGKRTSECAHKTQTRSQIHTGAY